MKTERERDKDEESEKKRKRGREREKGTMCRGNASHTSRCICWLPIDTPLRL